jgi:riboflavin synthase
MFTGIVQHVGRIVAATDSGGGRVLVVDTGPLATEIAAGDSVAVSGVCQTATTLDGTQVGFDVSSETLRLTTLGAMQPGTPVNLELALRLGDRLGGHMMSGHVDGVGTIRRLERRPGETRLEVAADAALTDHMIHKGSVAIDGISLTIAALGSGTLEVSVIPTTMAATTLADARPGDSVNLECDMIGRWVRKLLGNAAPPSGLTMQSLEEMGF